MLDRYYFKDQVTGRLAGHQCFERLGLLVG